MSGSNFMDEIKKMDKKEKRALLEKITNALTPEQQKQVKSILQDKDQMETIQKNLRGDDLHTLVDGLSGGGDARDFLNSPQVQQRMKELLDQN